MNTNQNQQIDPIVRGLCALMGGGIGLQYWVNKQYISGLVCLGLCLTFIPLIWGIIHGSFILIGALLRGR